MKVYNPINKYNTKENVALTTGTFDGVHLGHQKVLKQLLTVAEKHQLVSSLLSFHPHPRIVLQKDANIKLLNTLDEKIQLLAKLGLHQFIVVPFTKEFSNLSSEEFIKQIVIDKLNTKKLVIGYDHQFGKNREGNFKNLKQLEEKYDFDVDEIKAEDLNDITISSTKIRKALQNGNIELANSYLGYEYMLSGKILEGKKLGNTIGFATANLHIEEQEKLIPKKGSYVVNALIDDKKVFGMMNIGNNPTFNQDNLNIEIHFFDFNKNLYQQNIQVNLMKRIREEVKFNSIDELKNQLQKDKEYALDFIC